MAVKKPRKVGIVEWISPSDTAIDTSEGEDGEPISDIEKYKETWDFEKHCCLKDGEQPTKFKINFSIAYRKSVAIKNSTLGGFGKDQETGYKLGNHSNQVVRSILVDIINPEGLADEDKLTFKRDKKTNLVSEETMDELETLEIVDDIFSFWIKFKSDPENLKKS